MQEHPTVSLVRREAADESTSAGSAGPAPQRDLVGLHGREILRLMERRHDGDP